MLVWHSLPKLQILDIFRVLGPGVLTQCNTQWLNVLTQEWYRFSFIPQARKVRFNSLNLDVSSWVCCARCCHFANSDECSMWTFCGALRWSGFQIFCCHCSCVVSLVAVIVVGVAEVFSLIFLLELTHQSCLHWWVTASECQEVLTLLPDSVLTRSQGVDLHHVTTRLV